jgi:VanZ family protein
VKDLVFYWLPILTYGGLVYFFSSISHPRYPFTFYSADKFYHIGEYAILGILIIRLLKRYFPDLGNKKLKILAILLAILYGVSDEFHQYFVPFRDASFLDLFADGIGSLLGVVFYVHLIDKGKA